MYFEDLGQRIVVWFSCGAASAVAAKLALKQYGSRCKIVYCDTSSSEHIDNIRFLNDVEKWLFDGRGRIIRLRNDQYKDIFDLFLKKKFIANKFGAICTVELKKKMRFLYQKTDDIHIFGYSLDEKQRIEKFLKNNPELYIDPILFRKGLTHTDCLAILMESNIEIPEMYRLGYKHNNCLGCVKGKAGYWNKIRVDFPDVFKKMAKIERILKFPINQNQKYNNRSYIYLDELSTDFGNYKTEESFSCGVICQAVLDNLDKVCRSSSRLMP